MRPFLYAPFFFVPQTARRVNKKYLNKFYNKNVRIVGKVLKKEGGELTLQTCDSKRGLYKRDVITPCEHKHVHTSVHSYMR